MRTAAGFCQDCQPGLGTRFLDEVSRAGGRITDNPAAWPVVSGQIRRCLLNYFPFGLLYRIEPERIYVLAVMHLRREPNYWRKRVG
jgi:hypothetical protein